MMKLQKMEDYIAFLALKIPHMSLHRFASYVQIAGDFKWKMPRNVLGYTSGYTKYAWGSPERPPETSQVISRAATG